MAARAVTQAYDSALGGTGLKSTQFTLLATLAAQGPVSIGQLARVMVMDRTTMTRNLKPLSAAGYIRLISGEDRRVREVQITETGLAIFQRALPAWRVVQNEIEKKLGAKKWAGMRNDLIILIRLAREFDATHR